MTGKQTGTEYLRKQARQVSDGGELPVSAEVAANVQIEAWLQSRGVQYAPPAMIPMAFIDERKSRANQARKESIVNDSVERYATALRQGAVFPPIVGYPVGGKFVIIDGNNRQAAAKKAGRTEISAIMIAATTPSELITLLTIEANSHHGKAPDPDWRIRQAFQLMGIGYDQETAAEAVAISVQTIRNAKAAKEASERARAMKINGFPELPATTRQNLNVLKDDPVFFQASTVAVRTKMTIDEVRDMIKLIKEARSEGEKIAVIGQIADDRDKQDAVRKALGKRTSITSPAHSLAAASGKILKIDPAALARSILTSTDRDNAKNYLDKVVDQVLALQIALDTLKDLDEPEENQ